MEEATILNEEYNTLLPTETLEMQSIPVAPLYSRIRSTIIRDIDISYDMGQLNSPEIKSKLFKPIIHFLIDSKNKSAIFCCLLNSWDFKRLSFKQVGMNDINLSRALACEILATELLAFYSGRIHELTLLLMFEFNPHQGIEDISITDNSSLDDDEQESILPIDKHRFSSALGIACRSYSKLFTANPLVQIIIQKVWRGDIVFYSKQIDSDTYYSTCENNNLSYQAKQALRANIGLHFSLPNRFGGIFRASRLRVPMYQNTLNIFFYLLLIIVYSLVLNAKSDHFNWQEGLLLLFSIGFTIEEFRQLNSSGIRFYFQSLWNFLDIGIYSVFIVYFALRFKSIHESDGSLTAFAHDLLSCNAILMWPRLLMILDGYPFFGILIITMKHMFMDATLFFTMAIIIFIGFFQAFFSLEYNNNNNSLSNYDATEIFMLMIRIFFGSAYIGFDTLKDFKTIIGASVMFLYITLTALFLMTILMSIFNESFSTIYKNASQEHLFNFTTKVMEFIENEALFPFVPPFNLAQIILVYPFCKILSQRNYAFFNRTLIRLVYAPFLILIYIYERYWIKAKSTNILMTHPLHRSLSTSTQSLNSFKLFNDSITKSASEIFQESMGLLFKDSVSGIDIPISNPIAPAPPPPNVNRQIVALETKCNKLEQKLDMILELLEGKQN